MAGELSASGLTAGQTNYYAVLRLSGQYLAGSTPEAYNATHWSTYKIPLAEASPGVYLGAAPVGLSPGLYDYDAYQQAGGSPATTDLQVASGGSYNSLVPAIKAKTDNLPASPAAVGSAMTLGAGAIGSATFAADAISAVAVSAAAVTKVQAGLATAAGLPANFASLVINSSGTVGRVTLVDTISAYTGNTPQTGDAYGRINPLIASGAFTAPALANAPTSSGGASPGDISAVVVPAVVAALGSPAAGTVVSSTTTTATLSGLPGTASVVGQHLYDATTGESRVIASAAAAGPNLALTLASAFAVAPPTGRKVYIVP